MQRQQGNQKEYNKSGVTEAATVGLKDLSEMLRGNLKTRKWRQL